MCGVRCLYLNRGDTSLTILSRDVASLIALVRMFFVPHWGITLNPGPRRFACDKVLHSGNWARQCKTTSLSQLQATHCCSGSVPVRSSLRTATAGSYPFGLERFTWRGSAPHQQVRGIGLHRYHPRESHISLEHSHAHIESIAAHSGTGKGFLCSGDAKSTWVPLTPL